MIRLHCIALEGHHKEAIYFTTIEARRAAAGKTGAARETYFSFCIDYGTTKRQARELACLRARNRDYVPERI
jgi:hypothetical protein